MGKTIFLMIAIAVLIVILALVAIMMASKKKRKTDYYSFYWIGVIWLVFGILTFNHVLIALGFIFGLVGIVHKKEWKKNKQSWKKLSKSEQKLMVILITAGIVILIVAVGALFFAKRCYW